MLDHNAARSARNLHTLRRGSTFSRRDMRKSPITPRRPMTPTPQTT